MADEMTLRALLTGKSREEEGLFEAPQAPRVAASAGRAGKEFTFSL
jgi:hypothetical protein